LTAMEGRLPGGLPQAAARRCSWLTPPASHRHYRTIVTVKVVSSESVPPEEHARRTGSERADSVNVVREVGKRIRQRRTSKLGPKMTQSALAQQAEISISFLSMIERGERAPHIDTLAKVARALQVPITELFSFDGDAEKVDPLYKPLLDYCRKQQLSRRDVDRIINVVRSVFS
jgi:transcriptional regulator with XRE-family HTH domain